MRIIFTLFFLNFVLQQVFSQNSSATATKNNSEYKYSVYTTWLTFSNFGKPETNTHHYEFQFGYQLTPKDRIGVKFATWELFAPMGIPIWEIDLNDKEKFYPGRLKETGIGITYQHKLWKGLFTSIEIVPLFTTYKDQNANKISKGFKLYNSYHIGYHIPLFKKGRLFIEPQLHINHWPINNNVPETFKIEENKWNNYFLIEPNLYIGFKF